MDELFFQLEQIKDFMDIGQTEVHDLDTAIDFAKFFSQHKIRFTMKYAPTPMGEYWLFTKNS